MASILNRKPNLYKFWKSASKSNWARTFIWSGNRSPCEIGRRLSEVKVVRSKRDSEFNWNWKSAWIWWRISSSTLWKSVTALWEACESACPWRSTGIEVSRRLGVKKGACFRQKRAFRVLFGLNFCAVTSPPASPIPAGCAWCACFATSGHHDSQVGSADADGSPKSSSHRLDINKHDATWWEFSSYLSLLLTKQ